MTTDILFSSFDIKRHRLKNRIGVAPMTRMSSAADSIPRQDVLDFLVRRAKNDVALIYTEAIITDYESAQGYPGQARITTQRQIDTWGAIVAKIHSYGAKAVMQIFHCGRIGWPQVNPAGRTLAPSAIAPQQDNPLTGIPYPIPDEMSLFDIEHVVNGFGETARGAAAAGFDIVEVHGAHGYLISQFLSSYSNQRTDAYGGSPVNRFRFAREVIDAVKAVLPEDRLLFFRISNWGIADMDVSLFQDAAEYQTIIKRLSETAIDAISVSTYDFSQKAFDTDRNMAQLTREATDLPLLICGKIYDRKSAEQALKHADIVLSGKSLLLNPNWVADIKANKTLPVYKAEEANIAYTDTPLP